MIRERATIQTQNIVFLASELAGQGKVEPEHLLLSFIVHARKTRSLREGVAINALKDLGIRFEPLQKKLETFLGDIPQVKEHELFVKRWPDNISIAVQKIFDFAEASANEGKDQILHTGHLLLGILQEEQSYASQILVEVGAYRELITSAIQTTINMEEHDLWSSPKKVDVLAPWALDIRHIWDYLQFPLYFYVFICGSLILVVGCFFCEQYGLIAMSMFVLLFAALSSSIYARNNWLPFFEKVPLLNSFNKVFQDIHNYYFQNKPRHVFFYYISSFFAPIIILFSPRFQAEAKLYGKILWPIILFLLFESLILYPYVYWPYLNGYDVFLIILVQMLFLFTCFFIFFLPTITTCFTLSLTGKSFYLSFLVGTVFLMFFLFAWIVKSEMMTQTHPKILSTFRLELRLTKPNFCKDLKKEILPFSKTPSPLLKPSPSQKGILVDGAQSNLFQAKLSKILVEDERKAFRVFMLRCLNTQKKEEFWKGICLQMSSKNYFQPIAFCSPEGEWFFNWSQLPDFVKEEFQIMPKDSVEEGKSPLNHQISKDKLLED